MDMAKLEGLRFVAGMKLLPVMASGDDIRVALERVRVGAGQRGVAAAPRKAADVRSISEITHRLSADIADADLDEQQSVAHDSALVQLVNKMIIDAIEQKASDIHIEAILPAGTCASASARTERSCLSRPRVQVPQGGGVAHQGHVPARHHRAPQAADEIEFRRFGPLDVDLRVATIPTSGGLEDVVMRVLGAATPVPMAELGFDPQTLEHVKRLISRPHGLFLVAGRRAQARPTTHSLLAALNAADTKIWTAEDPIEIAQRAAPGQVNPKIGWTFAAAMRSFMRADPDVIMVGEMRDPETAKIGVEASLTGHLVLSAAHQRRAGKRRGSSISARIAQLRRRPPRRAVATPRAQTVRRTARSRHAERDRARAARGGVLWRVGHDPAKLVLLAQPDEGSALPRQRLRALRPHRLQGAPGHLRAARRGRVDQAPGADARSGQRRDRGRHGAQSMRTLKQDGIDKVVRGLTDLHEVHTVLNSGGDRFRLEQPLPWPRKRRAANVVATSQPLAQAKLQMLAAGGARWMRCSPRRSR